MALSLSQAVGPDAPNGRADVERVQLALTEASGLTLEHALHPGPADGVAGPGTASAVAAFQRLVQHTARPDARIDPGGRTETALDALLSIGEARWIFPFKQSPDRPYVGPGAGMRAFRARRSGGKRSHAGADLYRPEGTLVRAVDRGVVSRVAYFYSATWAVEVEHVAPDGHRYTVRYGEVAPNPPVKEGDPVCAGQVVGRVGDLRGLSLSMCHFELYLGTEGGALTQSAERGAQDRVNGRPFVRRRDLLDPTGLLRRAPLAR